MRRRLQGNECRSAVDVNQRVELLGYPRAEVVTLPLCLRPIDYTNCALEQWGNEAAKLLIAHEQHEYRQDRKSVVSRGGRPDLADTALPRVQAPTLLIVGGYDDAVQALNEQAQARMTTKVSLKIVPRASHLFEEPGALSQVADFAAAWFWDTLKPKK